MSNIKYLGLVVLIFCLFIGSFFGNMRLRDKAIYWEQNTTIDLIEIKEDLKEANGDLILLRIEMDTLLNRIAAK